MQSASKATLHALLKNHCYNRSDSVIRCTSLPNDLALLPPTRSRPPQSSGLNRPDDWGYRYLFPHLLGTGSLPLTATNNL